MCDLEYAEDTVLLDTSHKRIQTMTEAVESEGKKIWLYVNVGKCKIVVSNNWRDDTEIKIGG